MGTNYYINAEPPCEKCGHGGEDLHIGKSSAGWQFLFAPYPERGLTSFVAWLEYIAASGAPIRDEYGATCDLGNFIKMVVSKQRTQKIDSATDRLDEHGYRFARTAEFSWANRELAESLRKIADAACGYLTPAEASIVRIAAALIEETPISP